MNYINKTAVITGASKGIGREIALLFAKQGYNTIINYNSSEKEANDLKKEIDSFGGRSVVFKADISDFSEAKALIGCAVDTFGSVDVLVNNAGIAQIKLFTDISEEDWTKMVSTNLTGVFNCCRHAVVQMLKQHSGSIINISSMWGQVGASCEVHYSAVKGGVIAMTKALAKELGLSGIRVNCICPGVIMTDMMKDFSKEDLDLIKEEIPLNKFGTPADIAKTTLFLSSEEAGYITGQVIGINGGMVI